MSPTEAFPCVRTEIAGHQIDQLVEKFGTPTYVYDASAIAQRIEDLKPFDVIRYAQKACSNIAILNFMRKRGVVVDAVSVGEVARAEAAGYPLDGEPPPIVYTADIFDRASLECCVEKGLHVNCGSPDMITQLGERAPGREITLRLNPGFGHGHSQKTNTGGEQSKHGIWHEQLSECLQKADWYGLRVTGLHMHIGSGTDLEHLSQVCEAMYKAASQVGRTLTAISAGGGLPIRYKAEDELVDLSAYYELWDQTRKKLENDFGHRLRLEIEPGRYLVAESGYLLSEIRAVKKMGDNLFYLVDAGFNNLARPILYGAHHPMSIVPSDGRTDRPTQPVVIGGPLCESGDIFTQTEGGFVAARDLPQAGVGDFLCIECAGAYGFVMSSNYNGKPFAGEVLLQGERADLIRERESIDDLLRGERIVD